MNILITGGTGFIGSALTRSLLEQGYEVECFKPQSRFCSETLWFRR